MTDGGGLTGRNADGTFAVGNSISKLGTRHKATRMAEELLDGDADKLTRKAIEMAMAGDTTAIRLCLERILPPRKDRPISFELPKIETTGDCTGALTSLLTAVAAGDVTLEEGNVVASLIEKHVRIRETSDFEARLKALEERIGNGDSK
jgi:hypothetical protein